MSIFEKILASVGIGSATVNTHLKESESNQWVPGGILKGEITIQGGAVEQTIEEIDLHLRCTYTRELSDQNAAQQRIQEQCTLQSKRVLSEMIIKPNEIKSFPFELLIPYYTPVTLGKCLPVYLQTNLAINLSIDPSDQDYLNIQANQSMHKILEAIRHLGFYLSDITCEYRPVRYQHHQYDAHQTTINQRIPFVQEFEFKPKYDCVYKQRLDELELIFMPNLEDFIILLEIDRKTKPNSFISKIEELLDIETDETLLKLSMLHTEIESSDIETIAQTINEIIEKYSHS